MATDRRSLARTLVASSGALALLLSATASGASTRATRVAAKSRISGPVALSSGCAPTNAKAPHAAVDPSHPGHIAVAQVLGEGISPVVATSRDGGTSWSRAPLTGMTPCTGSTEPDGHVADPMIAVGAAGRVAATAGWVRWTPDFGVDHDAVRLYLGRSDDGGASFERAVEPEPGGTDQRGPVSFDPGSNESLLAAFERLHYLNLPAPFDADSTYLLGLGSSLGVARSSDGGTTWDPAVTAVNAPSGVELATIALLRSAGAVVLIGAAVDDASDVAFLTNRSDTLPEHLFTVRSRDGGVHWTAPKAIPGATYEFPRIIGPATPGWAIPDASVGEDGSLSVAFPDSSHRGIVVYRSSDGGETWRTTTPVIATGAPLEPAVATGTNGSLGVFFYDVVTNGDHQWVTPRLASSTDGGVSWQTIGLASPFDVSALEASACPDGLFTCDGTPMGPYQDLIPVPGGFAATVTIAEPKATTDGAEAVWWIRVAI